MIILQQTDDKARTRLRLTRYGLVTEYLRPRVGGGWYVKNSIYMSWPWRKGDIW